jgi:26S proteasome regulatory subunit T4
MDGFDSLGRVKLIMATNRPDTLDPALLRPGRLDRKIEIPLPNDQARLEILKIHAAPVNKSGEIDYEAIVKLSDGFNGADLRNVITEAGMFAIRDEREYIIQEDLAKAARKVQEAKKHESQCCSPHVLYDLLTLPHSQDGLRHQVKYSTSVDYCAQFFIPTGYWDCTEDCRVFIVSLLRPEPRLCIHRV